MNKMFLKKILLSALIFSLLSFGLTGCFHNGALTWADCNTSHVKIHLTSTYSDHNYNIYMDDQLYHADVPVGSYSIDDVSFDETHVFKVIHHKGTSFGSASKSVYIAFCEEHVYFSVTF